MRAQLPVERLLLLRAFALGGDGGIVALFVAVAVFMVKSRRASRVAFGCFVPYLLWLAFAAYLNAYVCLYN